MKFQIKVEYGQDELVKFYTEADVVDGIVRNYSFSSLVEVIRRTCGAATSHVQHFANPGGGTPIYNLYRYVPL